MLMPIWLGERPIPFGGGKLQFRVNWTIRVFLSKLPAPRPLLLVIMIGGWRRAEMPLDLVVEY